MLKSYLEFYGLNPVIPDYQQLALNPFKILAFGGIRIHLPEDQLELGQDLRASQLDYGLPDEAHTSENLRGMKARTIIGGFGWLFPTLGFIVILPPLIIALIWLALFPWLYLTLYWWFWTVIICIPLHAKYIALPRLRKRAV